MRSFGRGRRCPLYVLHILFLLCKQFFHSVSQVERRAFSLALFFVEGLGPPSSVGIVHVSRRPDIDVERFECEVIALGRLDAFPVFDVVPVKQAIIPGDVAPIGPSPLVPTSL